MTPRAMLAHLRGTIRRDVQSIVFATRNCRNSFAIVRAILRRAKESTVVLRDGTTFTGPELRTLHPLINEIYFKREYERGRVRVGAGDVVVDIGAHVGVFSIYALMLGASRVLAFEPSPVNAHYFIRNLGQNYAASISLVEAAVGERSETVSLGMGEWSVGNVVIENVVTENVIGDVPEESIDVQSTTLDAIFADYRLERIHFLKIDCEGSEGAILSATAVDV